MTVQEKALNVVNECSNNGIPIALLGNTDENGNPQIKALIKTANDGLHTFWFCSNTSSRRVNQIKKNGNSCLYFFNGFEGVMLRGNSEISYDDEIRKSFWHDNMLIYYPKGYTDPDFALIKFSATSGNYYNNLQNEDFEVGM